MYIPTLDTIIAIIAYIYATAPEKLFCFLPADMLKNFNAGTACIR